MRHHSGAGGAHQPDGLSHPYGVSDLHVAFGIPEMDIAGVEGLPTDIVSHHHEAGSAGSAMHRAHHSAVCDGANRGTFGHQQILAQMIRGGTLHRNAARTVPRAEGIGVASQRVGEAGIGTRGAQLDPAGEAGSW